jgi:tetratricopeptide (TPR) repeat protein
MSFERSSQVRVIRPTRTEDETEQERSPVELISEVRHGGNADHIDSPGDRNYEIYARPSGHWKVFISSQMGNRSLEAERAAAVEAVNDFPLSKAWAWEIGAPAGPYYSVEECVGQAATADALILILGEEITEVTRLEYEAAHAAGAPIFAMIKADQNRTADLSEFIELLRTRGITVGFSTPGELASRITEALRSWALRSARSEQIRSREGASIPPVPDGPLSELTELEGREEKRTTLGELVAEVRTLAGESKADEAAELVWEVAQRANDSGRRWLAKAVLDALEEALPEASIGRRRYGWILNARGLALSGTPTDAKEAITCFSRMRQIGRELEDVELESTALQNLGVSETIAGRVREGGLRTKESVELRMAAGDLYGALEVLTNMVNVFIPEGRVDLAESLINSAFGLLKGVRSPELRNTLYGHRSTIARERGDLTGAHKNLQLALAAAQRAKSIPREITTLQNLGSNAADRGKPKEAARWYEKALERADSIKDLSNRRIQRQSLGLAAMRAGESERAASLFETAAAEAEELGDETNAAIAIGDAGACYLQSGDVERAITLTNRALNSPGPHEDRWRYGQLLNLGVELTYLDRDEDALAAVLRAANLMAGDAPLEIGALSKAVEIAAYIPDAGDQLREIIDRELALRGETEPAPARAWRAAEIASSLRDSHHRDLAARYFSSALRSYSARGDLRQVFFVRNDRATLRADLSDLNGARSDLRRCLVLAEELKDRFLSWQAHRNLGEIERRRGHDEEARLQLQTAIGLADQLDDPGARGDVLALLGLLETQLGDLERASALFAEAKKTSEEIHSQTLTASALKGEARIAFVRGRLSRSATLYRRAVKLLDGRGSRQLAESLNGVICSEAELGRVAEKEIQELDALSFRIGWDGIWIGELRQAFASLLRAGASFEDVVGVAALLLIISARDADTQHIDNEEDDQAQLFASAVMLISWTREDPTGERRKGILVAAEQMTDEEVARMIETLFGIAEEQPSISFPWPKWRPGR